MGLNSSKADGQPGGEKTSHPEEGWPAAATRSCRRCSFVASTTRGHSQAWLQPRLPGEAGPEGMKRVPRRRVGPGHGAHPGCWRRGSGRPRAEPFRGTARAQPGRQVQGAGLSQMHLVFQTPLPWARTPSAPTSSCASLPLHSPEKGKGQVRGAWGHARVSCCSCSCPRPRGRLPRTCGARPRRVSPQPGRHRRERVPAVGEVRGGGELGPAAGKGAVDFLGQGLGPGPGHGR